MGLFQTQFSQDRLRVPRSDLVLTPGGNRRRLKLHMKLKRSQCPLTVEIDTLQTSLQIHVPGDTDDEIRHDLHPVMILNLDLKGVRRLYPTAPSPPGGPEGFGAQAQDAPTCMATMVYQLLNLKLVLTH